MQSLARRLALAPRNPWPDLPVPIAMVITDLDVGGAERALVALATGLDRRRWAPHIIALGPEAELAGVVRSAGIPVACLDVDRRRPLHALSRLVEVLRPIQPRLIQGFLFHANVASRLAATRLRPRPWVVGGLRVAERRRRWHLSVDRATMGLSSGSVCVSEGVRTFSQTIGKIPTDRLTVIPNGIDPRPIDEAPRLDRASVGIPDRAQLALFVGRLDEQKGLFDLLNATSSVFEGHPDWHLAIVGDGPLRDDLQRRAKSLPNLSGRVHWPGRRSDVPSWLKTADLFILPSHWEGMPNAVLEAMAARLPVIGTSVEGTEELVIPGETGLLVPPQDPSALATAWADMARFDSRRPEMGYRGRERVESEFTLNRVTARYHALWAGLLGLDRNPEDEPTWPQPRGPAQPISGSGGFRPVGSA